MPHKTLIVAYQRAENASAAILALRRLGVPSSDIKRHPVSSQGIEEVAVAPEPPSGSGFFAWLFGSDAVADRVELYRKALDSGGTVISVRVSTEDVNAVYRVLQDYGPLDWEIASGTE